MAADQGLNQTQISRIRRAFGLQPHRVESWKLSKGPAFVDKVRDIIGLYMSPPENALVLAVDEKSQVQALDRTAPIPPMMPTAPARAAHDYLRHGTTAVFAAMDIVSGSVITRNHRRHRSTEFLGFLKEINAATPYRPRAGPGPGQLHHPQDPHGQGPAPQAPPDRPALHTHLGVLAQPRRTLARRADPPPTSTINPPLRRRTRTRHRDLDPELEQEPQTIVRTKTADQILKTLTE